MCSIKQFSLISQYLDDVRLETAYLWLIRIFA